MEHVEGTGESGWPQGNHTFPAGGGGGITLILHGEW